MGGTGLTRRDRPQRRRLGFQRLSAYDQHCLRVETPARPLQVGILAVLDGQALVDPAGRLRLAEIRGEIDSRVAGMPELHRFVFRPGPLAGRPLWVDDPAFRIDHHVGEVVLSTQGDDAALLALAEKLMARRLDRSRPLWRMWFVTGLGDGRVGVLIVLHHALADGLTAMRLVRRLLEPPMSPAGRAASEALVEADPPRWGELVLENLRSTVASVGRLARPATWREIAEVAVAARRVYRLARHAPRTSLNAPVGPRRRLATVRLDVAAVKRVARAHGSGANDVLLSLIAGGVRALLEGRGEPVERLRPRVGVAVALRSPGHGEEAGNDIGTLHIGLPIGEAGPRARLPLIAAESARAKRSPMVAAEPIVRAWFGRFAVFRRALDHQRLVNLAETYLPGPPVPIEVLGARVLDLLPIAPLAGNLGLSFVALSYAGRLAVTVRVDADQFPDLDVLLAAMERDWHVLASSVAPTARSRQPSERSHAGSAA